MACLIKSWIATTVYIIAAAAALSAPACQGPAPSQTTLNVHTANLSLPGPPFGVVYARKDIAFAAIANGNISVLNTSSFTPTIIRQIALPSSFISELGFGVSGLAISHNKKTLYASVGTGAVAIDVEKAVSGEAPSIAGFLNGTVGTTSIETTVSRDDDYVFVSQEDGSDLTEAHGAVEVFHVQRAKNGSISSIYISYITLGYAVVGSALSHDGSKLYVTSEISALNSSQGSLSILDVETLKTNPSGALLASVDAGCSPVRVKPSPNGKTVWVNARESNKLLAFDSVKLLSNSSDALLASVQVGTSPVGLIFVNHGRHIVTADSNRFTSANATSALTVVDAAAALKGKQGFPRIPAGLFPREFTLSQNGKTLLVSDYGSDVVQAVNITQLASV
ncbi:hypothetical protein EG329_014474 [Mollisiaceae sp. DMI_Dod_QoI]|nr:hypothetical protein EG329_014474 [Helotiales sp. DMI_Dod_QoI]